MKTTWQRAMEAAGRLTSRHARMNPRDRDSLILEFLSIHEPPDLQAERAACMEEAAQACDPYRRYGGHVLIDGRLVSAAEAASIAIRALAPMPPGYVAVRTKDLEDVLFDTFEHVPPSLYNRLRAALTEDPNG